MIAYKQAALNNYHLTTVSSSCLFTGNDYPHLLPRLRTVVYLNGMGSTYTQTPTSASHRLFSGVKYEYLASVDISWSRQGL